jgi:hypothetical protein
MSLKHPGHLSRALSHPLALVYKLDDEPSLPTPSSLHPLGSLSLTVRRREVRRWTVCVRLSFNGASPVPTRCVSFTVRPGVREARSRSTQTTVPTLFVVIRSPKVEDNPEIFIIF